MVLPNSILTPHKILLNIFNRVGPGSYSRTSFSAHCVLSLTGQERGPSVRRAHRDCSSCLCVWRVCYYAFPRVEGRLGMPRSSVTIMPVTKNSKTKFITYVSTASNTHHVSHDLLSLNKCQTRRFNYSVSLIRNQFILKHSGGFM